MWVEFFVRCWVLMGNILVSRVSETCWRLTRNENKNAYDSVPSAPTPQPPAVHPFHLFTHLPLAVAHLQELACYATDTPNTQPTGCTCFSTGLTGLPTRRKAHRPTTTRTITELLPCEVVSGIIILYSIPSGSHLQKMDVERSERAPGYGGHLTHGAKFS